MKQIVKPLAIILILTSVIALSTRASEKNYVAAKHAEFTQLSNVDENLFDPCSNPPGSILIIPSMYNCAGFYICLPSDTWYYSECEGELEFNPATATCDSWTEITHYPSHCYFHTH